MKKDNLYFSILLVGLAIFLFIFTAEIFFDMPIITSVIMFFVILTLLLIALFIFSIKYVKQFKDIKGKLLLGVLLLSSGYYVIISAIVLMVMDY